MAMTINTNISSLNAQRNLGTSQSSLSTSMQRLSSGMRINSAKDDAAGLAIATRMGTQITGLNQAQRNANDGVSLMQTAEGALSSIGTNLQRIRELAVQSRNATNSDEDRSALQKEVSQLTSEIDRVASTTAFNGTNLLDGSFTKKAFQVGANQGQMISIDSIVNSKTSQLGEWTSVTSAAKLAGGDLKAATTAVPVATAAAVTIAGGVGGAIGTAGTAGNARFGWAAGLEVQIGNGTKVTMDASAYADGAEGYKTEAEAMQGLANAIHAKLTSTDGALPEGVKVTATTTGISVSNASLDRHVVTVTGTGLTGTAATGIAAGTPAFSAIAADELKINNVDIIVKGQYSDNASTRQSQLVEAINGKTGQTNVTASISGGKIVLESKFGDVDVKGAAATLAENGFAAANSKGTTGEFIAAGKKTGFESVDVSTVGGADNAILAMDAALKAVNSARADLGAIQNRFESVVSNLSVNSENLSASKSRIMDADFAAETANLSRSQVLQQAGTAMVAQANQLPQGVLSLLR